MVRTIVSPISMIWEVFSQKKSLQCLVYSILVLIYIYFSSSFVVLKSNLGSGSVSRWISWSIYWSTFYWWISSYNCFGTWSQSAIHSCLVLTVSRKHVQLLVLPLRVTLFDFCLHFVFCFDKFVIDTFLSANILIVKASLGSKL